MEVFAAIFGFIISFVLSLIIANAGAKRQIGFGWSLFLGVWLTPIVSLIAVLLSDKIRPDEYGRVDKKWGCMIPFIISFLILGTVAYVIYSFVNRDKGTREIAIELSIPQVLNNESISGKAKTVEPEQNNRSMPKEKVGVVLAPEVLFDEPINLAYESLTKKGTNPANEIKVDLNDFLGTLDDGVDWNSTELSESDCKTLARQKIYYSENKAAWVKEKLSNNDSEKEAQQRREAAERDMKEQAQTGARILGAENAISRHVISMSQPSMTKDIEGMVVLKVEINPDGEVIKCEIDDSSTINDTDILKQCTKAALRTKYNAIDSNSNQFEKITYRFSVK